MPVMITSCPHCQKVYRVDEGIAGQPVRCSRCGRSFPVQEYLIQPKVYHTNDVPCDDGILSPPIATPSYKETPILRTSFKPAAIPGTGDEQYLQDDVYGRTIPDAGYPVPLYRALKWLAVLHIYGGILALIIGVLVFIAGLDRIQADGQTVGTAVGMSTCMWGLGISLYGLAAVTAGKALIALRDLAINSYLAL